MRIGVPTSPALRRSLLLATLGAATLVVPSSAFGQTPGELTQKPEPDGCISQSGDGGNCEDGRALNGARRAAVSPDGQNVYATSIVSDAIVILDRDPATGTVDQKPGLAGCISDLGAEGCVDGRALANASGVVVSPDGENVYVASNASDAVAIFDRDPTSGELSQKAGTAGCIDEQGEEGCQDGVAINGALGLVASPDGANVYVSSSVSDAVAVLDRGAGGGLTQKAGTAGCVSQSGTGGTCQDGEALNGASTVVLSDDGTNAYVASSVSDGVAILDRSQTNGELTQKAGVAGCITETGTGGVCQDGVALDGSFGVAIAPDGEQVYGASVNSDAVTVFDRDVANGELTQKGGITGCISDTGSGGACEAGEALNGARWVQVSPDGRQVYGASSVSDAITIFNRLPANGELNQKIGRAGCISNSGTGGACQNGREFNNVRALTVSPDGRNVYGAAQTDDAVSILDRAFPDAEISNPDPGPVDFGEQATGAGASDQVEVTVTSDGTSEVTFDASAISGPDAADFAISQGNCDGSTLDPNATCTIDVTFDPSSIGDKTAMLEVNSDGQSSSDTVTLTGTGTAPQATITDPSPGPLDLGDQPVDAGPGPARLVTVTSTGETPVTFQSPAIVNAPDGQFLAGGNCEGATLAPGESCRIGVSFDPVALGEFGAMLEVRSDDPGSPDTLGLVGTGTPAGSSPTPPAPDVDLNDYRALSGGQCATGGSVVLTGPQISGDEILFGATQLRTNQRIGQAAIVRVNAIEAWLEGGIEGRDIRGAVLGIDNFGAGVEWRVGSPVPIPPANPRPIDPRPLKPVSDGDQVTFTLQQLIINQRVYQEAIARANALERRLDGMLTGGDVVDGSVGEGRLLPGLRIATLTPVTDPPAASRTDVRKPKRGESDLPQFSSTQLVTNQRIAATAVARTNALIERIESGLDACSFAPGSLTGNDLTPPAPPAA